MSAVGLPAKVSLAPSQSSAFFSAPGSPWAYSGAAMTSASLASTSAQSVSTGSGLAFFSHSSAGVKRPQLLETAGEKTFAPRGREPRQRFQSRRIDGGAPQASGDGEQSHRLPAPLVVDLRGLDEAPLAAENFDRFDLRLVGCARCNGDEAQTEQASEIGLRDRGRAGGALAHGFPHFNQHVRGAE